MKLWIYILIFLVCPLIGNSQVITDITKINNELTERPWLDHSAHELYGYTITTIFGERPSPQRHSNLGSITNMAYLDQDQLLDGLDTLDVQPGQKEKLREMYHNANGGGIQLFIARRTESRANFKWYFIVIRGVDDEEKIMEIDLEYQASQLPEANGWWNFTTILLPEPVEFPFYVYVNDKQSQYLSDYKFRVNR